MNEATGCWMALRTVLRRALQLECEPSNDIKYISACGRATSHHYCFTATWTSTWATPAASILETTLNLCLGPRVLFPSTGPSFPKATLLTCAVAISFATEASLAPPRTLRCSFSLVHTPRTHKKYVVDGPTSCNVPVVDPILPEPSWPKATECQTEAVPGQRPQSETAAAPLAEKPEAEQPPERSGPGTRRQVWTVQHTEPSASMRHLS